MEYYNEPCDECGNVTKATSRELAEGVLCADCKTYPSL